MEEEEFPIGLRIMHEDEGPGTVVDHQWWPNGEIKFVKVDFDHGLQLECSELEIFHI